MASGTHAAWSSRRAGTCLFRPASAPATSRFALAFLRRSWCLPCARPLRADERASQEEVPAPLLLLDPTRELLDVGAEKVPGRVEDEAAGVYEYVLIQYDQHCSPDHA